MAGFHNFSFQKICLVHAFVTREEKFDQLSPKMLCYSKTIQEKAQESTLQGVRGWRGAINSVL